MIIEIDNKLVSSSLLTECFCCDLGACRGTCCVQGVSGAPLRHDEAHILEQILPELEPYLSAGGLAAIRAQGCAVVDSDGDLVTPLRDGLECAFTVFDNGNALCAIELAWKNKKVHFRKPISCHLYPIRVTRYQTFDALNFDTWAICNPARKLGKKMGLPVFKFLKEPIIRAFGQKFYMQMVEAHKLMIKQNNRNCETDKNI